MSIEQFVAISKVKLPSTARLSERMTMLGFESAIEPADLSSHAGYLPVRFMGKESGFEWYLDPVGPGGVQPSVDVGERDAVVGLRTGSDATEAQCSMVCAAALMGLADGVYFNDYEAHLTDPDQLISEVQEWLKGSS
ncbi:MAG: hypothetical protein AAGD00_02735 [Planctomycetota bacterium]